MATSELQLRGAETPSAAGVDDRSDRYCVLGAGPSGLATARALARAGIPFEVLERQDDVGGIWNGDAERTPMYESAHFISSKTLSAFTDFPMPAHYPDYPSWRLIRDYLHSFADAFDLRRHVETCAEVASVEPSAGERWVVRLASGTVRRYRGVVLAMGHQWTPRLPSYPGRFAGEAYHAFHYRGVDEMRGKRVLVVGGGNSGCDIACDAASSARETWLSLRRGYHFLPKHLFGKPTDVFFRSGPELPTWIAQPLLGFLLRVIVGDLGRLGLQRPDHRVLESHPIMNSQLLHHLAHGDISPKPDVRELDGRRIRFVDGSDAEVELIIWATGYEVALPGIPEDVLSRAAPTTELLANVLHRRHPSLYVMGLFETDGGAYPVVSRQAELVARAIGAREKGGGASRRLEERLRQPGPDLSGGIRYIRSARHTISVQYEAYMRYLARLIDELPATSASARAV